ncbi:Uncharacterised protein [Mycobacteroides abscessus subsp. massiliense]|nr:Uncharacterised protein [Mycobacteroides abscessus subsp. massiliense]
MIAVAARVQELHDDLAAVLVYGVGDYSMPVRLQGGGELTGQWFEPRCAIDGVSAGDDHANAALGALGEVGRQRRSVPGEVLEAGMHGAHDNSVLQRRESEIQGG